MSFLTPRSLSSKFRFTAKDRSKSEKVKTLKPTVRRTGGSAPQHRRSVSHEGRIRHRFSPKDQGVVYRYLEGAFMLRSQILLHHAWNPRYFRIALDTGSLSHCEISNLKEKPSSTDSNWSEPINLWQNDVHIEYADMSTLLSNEHRHAWELKIKNQVVITASTGSAYDRSEWIDQVNGIITTKSRNGNYSSIFAFQRMMNGTRVEKLKALKQLTEEVNRCIKKIMSEPGAPKSFNSQTRQQVKEFVIETFGSLAYERFKTNIRSLQATWVERTIGKRNNPIKSGLRRRILELDEEEKKKTSSESLTSPSRKRPIVEDTTDESTKVDYKHSKKDDGSVSPVRRRRSTSKFRTLSSLTNEDSVTTVEEKMLLAVEEIISEREESFQLASLRNLVIERFGVDMVEKYKWEIMFMHATRTEYTIEDILDPGVIRTLLNTVKIIVKDDQFDAVNWRSIKTALLKKHTANEVQNHKRICQTFLEAFTRNTSYRVAVSNFARKKKRRGFMTRCLNSNVVGLNVKYINVLRIVVLVPIALLVLYSFPTLHVHMMPFYLLFVLPVVPFVPNILGWSLTTILRITALNGHPFDVGSLEIIPSIRRDHNNEIALHMRFVVHDAGFGNPTPDYPHYYFVECKRCDFEFSIPLASLWNLRRWNETGWSPFPNEVMQNIRIRERRKAQLEQQRKDNKKLRERLPTIVDENEMKHPLDRNHRREISSGSSDSHRRDASWDSILSDDEQQQQQQQQKQETKETTSQKIFKYGTLEIIAANAIIDDDTHEWRSLKSHRRIQPYRAPAEEYRHFGHTDGNRMTPLNATGHIVPAVRMDCDLNRYRNIVQECQGWNLVWDNAKDEKSTPTCSIWMPKAPIGFSALGVTCITGDDASKPPQTKVLCIKKSHTTAIDTRDYPSWSDDGSGSRMDIKLCILPHGLLWPVRCSNPTYFPPASGARTLPEFSLYRSKCGFIESIHWANAIHEETHRDETRANAKPIYLGNITFHHIHFETLQLNFEMFKREFNINGVSRVLAEGETRANIQKHARKYIGAMSASSSARFRRLSNNMTSPSMRSAHDDMRDTWWPNELIVKIKSANNLQARGHKSSGYYYAVATIRDLANPLKTGYNPNRSPKWSGQEMKIHVLDPSAVLHVQVFDKGNLSKRLVGQWCMTLKWLYINPRYCWHSNIEVLEDSRGVTISGDFVLQDEKWRGALGKLGMHGESAVCDPLYNCGTINMEISWLHSSQLSTAYLPSSQAALEQLKMNSAETNLRLGNLDNVTAMLRRFPLKFNVREVRLTNIDFYLKDLFSGKLGEAERSDVDATMMKSVFIPDITVNTALHPRKTDNGGIPLYDMLERFFLRGVSSKVMTNYMVYYKGLGSIFGGLFSQVYRTKSNVQTGSLKSTFVSLGNTGWFNEFGVSKKYLQRKYVTADDPDIEKAVLYEGYLEKSSRAKSKQFRNWKLYLFKLRGSTIFYQRVNPKTGLPSMELKKLVLSDHQRIDLRKDDKEIFLLEEDNDRFFRIPHIKKEALPDIMRGKIPCLEDWYKAIMRHRHRDHLHGDSVLIKLHSAKGLPTVSGKFEIFSHAIKPRCVLRVIDTSGDDVVKKRVSSEKHSHDPIWNEEFALGPVDVLAQVLVIEIHSDGDYVGEVTFPLLQFRKSDEQEFNIPLQDVDRKSSVKVSGFLRFKARIITSLL